MNMEKQNFSLPTQMDYTIEFIGTTTCKGEGSKGKGEGYVLGRQDDTK
jgi:hypothetical protein